MIQYNKYILVRLVIVNAWEDLLKTENEIMKTDKVLIRIFRTSGLNKPFKELENQQRKNKMWQCI
jgi:hypothetical protein